jgi:hypothetical protein
MEDTDQPVKHGAIGSPIIGTEREPFHCANDCPVKGDYNVTTELYACGWRHWCPWCGDCEYCYGEGPHEWD